VPKRPCALLWDESFLWVMMSWRALKAAGLPFDLLRSEDIRQVTLSRYRMIFVPGGWASNKINALGERGREEIRGLLLLFCEKAKRLLVGERFYMMSAPLSPVLCEDVEISRLRQELFASAMSHRGDFKRLI